ncbi:melatonin receptor type 1B-B-like [Oculina patagonica]
MSLSLLTTVSETTILCVICLAALIGNLSLYIIVYKNKDLRTITNLYILNLAAADIMVSVLSIPFTMVTVITGRWLFGDTACVALGFFTFLSFISSVLSLGMIAINRYFYIVKWNTYTKTFSKKKALLYAAAVWAVSISLALPPLFGWAEYRFIPGKSYCFVYWPSNVYFMYFMITVCFIGPLAAMAFSYYNILTFTRNLKRRIAVSRNNLTPQPQQHQPRTAYLLEPTAKNNNQNNQDSELDCDVADNQQINKQGKSKQDSESKSQNFQVTPEETKMTNTFLLVVALFIICWAPFAITMFFDVYYPSPLPRAVDMASLLLGYLNSICNPIMYGLRNSAFKQGFLDLYSRFVPGRFRRTNVTLLETSTNAPLGVVEAGMVLMNISVKSRINML